MPLGFSGRHERWAFLLLLAPFLVVAHLLNDLHAQILTFHGTDETLFHLPVILRFAAQLPFPHFTDYASATTPLFHVVFCLIGEAVGFDLYKLRAFNVVFSFLAVWVCYRIWRARFALDQQSSVLLAALLLISPYFFGASFVLLTDNLAWLFCLTSLYCFLRAGDTRRPMDWFFGALCLALTLLTRQSFVWMVPAAALFAWRGDGPVPAKVPGLVLVGLASLSLLPFIWMWHGLVPPSFQSAHEASGLINIRSFHFGLAVVGLYFPLLQCERALSMVRDDRLPFAVAVAAAVASLLLFPIGNDITDDGFLWRMSRLLPAVAGTSLLYWMLVPLGAAALWHLAWRLPRSLGALSLLFFLLSMLPSSRAYQKYFDPVVPLLVLMARERGESLSRRQRGLAAALIGGFLLYALIPYVLGEALLGGAKVSAS